MLTDFQTDEPAYSCLDGASLNVYLNLNGTAAAEAITPTDGLAQAFQLPSSRLSWQGQVANRQVGAPQTRPWHPTPRR